MRKPRRHTPSTIDRLDPEIRDLIGKLRIDRGFTIDEIRAALEKVLAAEHLPSRSALGRHVKSIEEVGAQLRQAREVAEALIAQVGEGGEDRLLELNIELLSTSVLRLLTATNDEGDGQPVTLDPMQSMLVSKTIQQLVSARKANAELVVKTREAAIKAAAGKARDAAKTRGLGKDTADWIYREVLGVEV
ncbi:DUF3486 family protein [Sphingomonas sp. AOB5]|uniref:phage protein Gp27 family protein n=1 Tax=Sphingomonas sp. AOB5 TaxID=3034017 RepID=UPI0023F883EB|nr:phage protein Gp27 family protein [Sphingomonas sp. AOB5]MDF7776884.1 DUF3486 family protein [Sphingomonas sp. AOB5]